MATKTPLNIWQQQFMQGKYDSNDLRTQSVAGWKNWKCGDRQLSRRLMPIGYLLCMLKDGGSFVLSDVYVELHNYKSTSSTKRGETYDGILIRAINTEAILYAITHKEFERKEKWTMRSGVGNVIYTTNKTHRLAGVLNRSIQLPKGDENEINKEEPRRCSPCAA
jgi:hypothetical protein